MKITLISTATFPSDQGIRTISSVLKKAGHKVKLVFMSYSEDYSKFYSLNELKQLYSLCKDSELVGISSFASTAPRAIQIIKFLNQKQIKVPIVWGGIHATISPEDCIKHVDIVCVGEGEGAILDLVNSIEKDKSFNKIKNLWIKDKTTNKIIKNPVRPVIENLDSLPFADYEIQDHYILENHFLRKFKEQDLDGAIFFLTGRGCPYGCEYCSNNFLNKLYKGKCKSIVRWHSIDYIINCILFLKSKFKKLSFFDIRDDTFSLRPLNQIKEFCEKYKDNVKMRFKCLGDPKTITEEKIKFLVDAGCTDIIIGIQGVERVNKEIYHRIQTDADVIRTAQILSKYKDKLTVMYDVITCNPYETSEDVINMIKLLQKLPPPFFLSINNLVFFPGSGLYQRAINDKNLKSLAEKSWKLNYWDRAKHIRLKPNNMYPVLILNLMRGSVTKKRFGFMPKFVLNYLINPKKVRKHLQNQTMIYIILYFVGIYDLVRERIMKPVYRSLPLNFKAWYDKVRYKT
ncbi:B12-binding domain-containing radical SAM protein [Nanoarchaeota archaeon]